MSAVTNTAANEARGEANVRVGGAALLLRPSFQALCAAEAEIGSLFDMVERAVTQKLQLHELVTLFWHCLAVRPEALTKAALGEAMVATGLARLTPALKILLGQILHGQ